MQWCLSCKIYIYWFIFSFEVIFKANFSSTLLRKLASFLTPFDRLWCNHLLHSQPWVCTTLDQLKEKNRNDLQGKEGFPVWIFHIPEGNSKCSFWSKTPIIRWSAELAGVRMPWSACSGLTVCAHVWRSFLKFQSSWTHLEDYKEGPHLIMRVSLSFF